jgi:hypothetical protein
MNQMKRIGLVMLMATQTGCIHLRPKVRVAPPEVAEQVQFPERTKDTTTTLEGPQLKALQIALEDFMPPGTKPPRNAGAMAQCLFRLDTYDVWLKRGEGMTFIHFTPRETERCGLKPEVMDPGASYAISDEGVILKRD